MDATMDELALRAKWAKKVAAVEGDMEAVTKDKTNDFQHYKYGSAEAVFAMIRPRLSKHGLAATATTVERDLSHDLRAILTVEFSLIDTDTGYSETSTFVGEGSDKTDKRIPKAYTMAAKYWAREFFLIDFEDDAEAAPKDEARGQDRRQAAPRREQQQAPAKETPLPVEPAAPALSVVPLPPFMSWTEMFRRVEIKAPGKYRHWQHMKNAIAGDLGIDPGTITEPTDRDTAAKYYKAALEHKSVELSEAS